MKMNINSNFQKFANLKFLKNFISQGSGKAEKPLGQKTSVIEGLEIENGFLVEQLGVLGGSREGLQRANADLVNDLSTLLVAKGNADMAVLELKKKNGEIEKENFLLKNEQIGVRRQNHALQREFEVARAQTDSLVSRNEELEREIQSLRSGANAETLEGDSVDRQPSQILELDYDQSESQAESSRGENLVTQAEPPVTIEDQIIGENPDDTVEPSMILEQGETESNGLERKNIGESGQNWNLQQVNAYVFKMDQRLKQIMTANPCSPSEKSKKKMGWVKGEITQAKRYAEQLWWHHLPKRAQGSNSDGCLGPCELCGEEKCPNEVDRHYSLADINLKLAYLQKLADPYPKGVRPPCALTEGKKKKFAWIKARIGQLNCLLKKSANK